MPGLSGGYHPVTSVRHDYENATRKIALAYYNFVPRALRHQHFLLVDGA